VNWNNWNWVPVILALGLIITIGVAQMFDASSS
jgi:hypothetical protein